MKAGILILAAFLAGAEAAPARTVMDMAGRSVSIPAEVRRIACLEVLCYERLYLLGASDRIAMMIHTNAPWMRRTNPAVDGIQQLSANPNTEELLRQRVDVVFRTYGYPDPAKVDLLARTGVPVVVSQTLGRDRIDSVAAFVASRDRMMRLYGEVLGGDYAKRAEEWCDWHDRKVAWVLARTRDIPPAQRLRLFHVRGPAANHSQGQASNTYWYGVIAGADMVIRHHPMAGKADFALEEILRWDPQVINVGRFYAADLVTRDPRWAQVAAVRDGRVRELPEGVFYWDGSTEGALLMLYLAKELYPERFPDLDLRREIRDYYSRFYRYRPSEAELDLMLAGRGPDGRRRNDMNN